MKRLLIFLIACLVPTVLPAAVDDASTARAARRAVTAVTASPSTRTPSSASNASTGRGSGISGRTSTAAPSESRATTTRTAVPNRTPTTTRNTTSRTATTRTPVAQTATVARGNASTTATRGATGVTAHPTTTTAARAASSVRAATSGAAFRTIPGMSSARSAVGASRLSRAALNAEAIAQIKGKDYKSCRDVYYQCMDEFCANKDTQLRRCACSSRVHEFDQVKAQLAEIEDKMLEFNQRLLTVNMDAEDVVAINTATEGELAFQQKDTSASKKMLDEIAAKLKKNSNTGLDPDVSNLTWSLNVDAAFDSIDSSLGANTSTKEGVALYNAALPVCQEMAAEVCDDDALELAVSGYLMQIEQDCTTVAKAFETQNDQVREKIREGGALLDMSRLDIHQKRNSDDILTCKKKMLDMLSDSSVCGNNLGKCLDTTGRYIDPSTGEAFLTENLIDLASLLTRPTGDTKWIDTPGNDKFVTYLNTKKQFLTPAMENCQDIADQVWDEFIEDALAQIKLAQDSKLEDMRQSCTSLTTQCLADTAKSLSDFDARALSIFGVARDKTVNEMCSSVKSACTALLDAASFGDTSWSAGMRDIATDTTYDTILSTCREVGRNCIIQACKSISGNFGLCENIDTSINRKAIINRTSCWAEVLQCVQDAGDDAIGRIYERQADNIDKPSATDVTKQYRGSFYGKMYGDTKLLSLPYDAESSATETHITDMSSLLAAVNGTSPDTNNWCNDDDCVYDICYQTCAPGSDGSYSAACQSCRLAEQIWGNCEFDPVKELDKEGAHNQIITTAGDTTLLSWFAKNTGTSDSKESCRDTTCGPGYTSITRDNASMCIPVQDLTLTEKAYCPATANGDTRRIVVGTDWENCCGASTDNNVAYVRDTYENCCTGMTTAHATVTLSSNLGYYTSAITTGEKTTLCLPQGTQFIAQYADGNYLLCVGDFKQQPTLKDKNSFPAKEAIFCDGYYVLLNVANNSGTALYLPPSYTTYLSENQDPNPLKLKNFVNGGKSTSYEYTNGAWQAGITPQHWQVQYIEPNSGS